MTYYRLASYVDSSTQTLNEFSNIELVANQTIGIQGSNTKVFTIEFVFVNENHNQNEYMNNLFHN